MAEFTPDMQRYVDRCGVPEAIQTWLKANAVLSPEDFGVMAPREEKVGDDILEVIRTTGPSRVAGAKLPANRIPTTKLWLACRQHRKSTDDQENLRIVSSVDRDTIKRLEATQSGEARFKEVVLEDVKGHFELYRRLRAYWGTLAWLATAQWEHVWTMCQTSQGTISRADVPADLQNTVDKQKEEIRSLQSQRDQALNDAKRQRTGGDSGSEVLGRYFQRISGVVDFVRDRIEPVGRDPAEIRQPQRPHGSRSPRRGRGDDDDDPEDSEQSEDQQIPAAPVPCPRKCELRLTHQCQRAAFPCVGFPSWHPAITPEMPHLCHGCWLMQAVSRGDATISDEDSDGDSDGPADPRPVSVRVLKPPLTLSQPASSSALTVSQQTESGSRVRRLASRGVSQRRPRCSTAQPSDQVSDAVLDTCLRTDPKSKVACETATKDNMVMVAGEITTQAKIDYDEGVRGAAKGIGYDRCAICGSSFHTLSLCAVMP